MDIQLKRGLLEVCVLSALRNGESYGYRMLQQMQPYVAMSESTLYPILRRLEAAQMVQVRTVAHNGRLRKYYSITPAGLARLEAFRGDWEEICTIYRFVTREGTKR